MQKRTIIYPLLLLIFWTGLMLTADFVVIETSVRQARSVDFASVTGKMVQSEIGKGAVSHRGVQIGYNYTVNEIAYTGHRYRYDDRHAVWEYSATVGAYPRWSARKVFYNPDDPADSILDPGLDGCDLLLLLFATPLNVVTLALWLAVTSSWRERKLSEEAGGVLILKTADEIRAQLSSFSPAAAALAGLGIGSFMLSFPVVSIGGFAPTMRLMLVVWALVLAVTAAAFLWRLMQNRAGVYDLCIDEVSKVVIVPKIFGGRDALILARNEILAVSLERRITKTPSGEYFSYLPAIDRRTDGPGASAIKLVTWGWTQTKANAFGKWLSGQLGVEFKGIQVNQAI